MKELTEEEARALNEEIQKFIDSLPKLTPEQRATLNWLGDPIPTEEDIARIRQETEDRIKSLSNPTPEIVAELRRDCLDLVRPVTSRECPTMGPKTK